MSTHGNTGATAAERVPTLASTLVAEDLVRAHMVAGLTWLGVALSCFDSAGRIGSTRPMPMKLTTQAKATA